MRPFLLHMDLLSDICKLLILQSKIASTLHLVASFASESQSEELTVPLPHLAFTNHTRMTPAMEKLPICQQTWLVLGSECSRSMTRTDHVYQSTIACTS